VITTIWFTTDLTPFVAFAMPSALHDVARFGAVPRSVTLPSSTSTIMPAVVVGLPLSWRRISVPILSLVGTSPESVGDGTACPMARMEGWRSFALLASVAQPPQSATLVMITPETKKNLTHISHLLENGARDRT
jgi:hypothetical protein